MLRVPVSRLGQGELVLDAKASRYVGRVHRVRAGDTILLFDPAASHEAEATVIAATRDGVRCRVHEVRATAIHAARRVTLVQGIGKGDKFDAVVRDATELGAARVIAVETSRAVVRLGARADERRARWRRIAAEAARQCGRGDAPEVLGPLSLGDALLPMRDERARKICLWERATDPIGPLLRSLEGDQGLIVLVGPEGGFEDEEVELARTCGFAIASLGPFILRTETAATAVLGAALLLGT